MNVWGNRDWTGAVAPPLPRARPRLASAPLNPTAVNELRPTATSGSFYFSYYNGASLLESETFSFDFIIFFTPGGGGGGSSSSSSF